MATDALFKKRQSRRSRVSPLVATGVLSLLTRVYARIWSPLMDDNLNHCLVLNSRMAARAITRRADGKLRPFGINGAQFNILAALVMRQDRSVTEMAKALAMDRTTLSRNLSVLERKGLVSIGPGGNARKRQAKLTEAGREKFDAVIPEWRRSQEELRQTLTDPDFMTTVAGLRHLSAL